MRLRSASGARSRRPMKRMRTPCFSRSGSSRSIVSPKISISASISSCGRDQFSVENAYTTRFCTPSWIAASTVRRSARVPARWPAAVGSPRRRAQRPFPSMMIATLRATSGRSPSGSGRARASVRIRESRLSTCGFSVTVSRAEPGTGTWPERSHLHDLGLFVLQQVFDLLDVLVGELLDAALRSALLVVADVAVSHELVEVAHHVAADVPHRDTPLLRHVPDELGELLTPLLGELWDRQPDQFAVVRRRQSEVGLLDRPLDLLDRRRVERLDREHPRLGHVDRCEVLQWRRRAVVINLDAVEQRGGGAAGTNGVEVVVRRLDRLVHALDRIPNEVVDRAHTRTPSRGVEMTVPTRSPRTTRSMFPGKSSNTWIGSALSMHSERAVVSITFRPCSIASRWVSSGRKCASGSVCGSPS